MPKPFTSTGLKAKYQFEFRKICYKIAKCARLLAQDACIAAPDSRAAARASAMQVALKYMHNVGEEFEHVLKSEFGILRCAGAALCWCCSFS